MFIVFVAEITRGVVSNLNFWFETDVGIVYLWNGLDSLVKGLKCHADLERLISKKKKK